MRKLFFPVIFLYLLAVPAVTAQEPPAGIEIKPVDTTEIMNLVNLAKGYAYNNPNLAKKYFKEAINLAHIVGHKRFEGASYNSLGICYRNLGEYDSAKVVFAKSIDLCREAGFRIGYGNARNNYAMTLFYLGEYEKANTYFIDVIRDAEEEGLFTVLANAYQNLGIIHNTQKRYPAALENFILAEKYHKLSNDEKGQSGAIANQAFILYKYLKQYDSAVAVYKKVISKKKKLGDEKGIGICYNNLAEIYIIKKDYEKAKLYLDEAIAVRKKVKDQLGLGISYYTLANVYYYKKKYKKAERLATMAVDILRKIDAKKDLSNALSVLSATQEQTKNMESAYTNLVDAVMIKDSLLNKENFARMVELETKYETQKKEREILEQRAKIAENQLKIDQKNMVIFGAFSLTVIAVLLGFLFFNRQKIKTIRLEKEAELKDALLQIETQNKLQEQRLQISRDLHDNIGSQLTFIISSLDNLKYSFDITTPGLNNKIFSIRNFTKDTITELRDTIWAMNKEEISLSDLETRISNFIENAKAASKGIHFVFEIDSKIHDTLSFSSLKGISLYRVIQESVNNALKHAEATEVHVTISKAGKNYIIRIKDNGKGFDADASTFGNGLSNIRKRVADSGGGLAIVSAPGEGTEIIITIK